VKRAPAGSTIRNSRQFGGRPASAAAGSRFSSRSWSPSPQGSLPAGTASSTESASSPALHSRHVRSAYDRCWVGKICGAGAAGSGIGWGAAGGWGIGAGAGAGVGFAAGAAGCSGGLLVGSCWAGGEDGGATGTAGGGGGCTGAGLEVGAGCAGGVSVEGFWAGGEGGTTGAVACAGAGFGAGAGCEGGATGAAVPGAAGAPAVGAGLEGGAGGGGADGAPSALAIWAAAGLGFAAPARGRPILMRRVCVAPGLFSWKVESTAGFFSPESTTSAWKVRAPSLRTSSTHQPSESEKKNASPEASVESTPGPAFGSTAW